MGEWRKWDTAPKDARIIMAHCNGEIRLVHWMPRLGGMSHPWADPSGYSAWGDDIFTHWHPLPEPPNDGD